MAELVSFFNVLSERWLPRSETIPSASDEGMLESVQSVLESHLLQATDENGSQLADVYAIDDEWFESGDTKWITRSWLEQVLGWCKEPTHFHMTLEDYLAALQGIVPGKKNFFELLPCENEKRPEREFNEFFAMARGSK